MPKSRCAIAVTCCCAALAVLAAPAGRLLAQDEGTVQVAELSPKTEAAIDKALAYLAKSQAKDGSIGGGHPEAYTALALMAFMVKGHFPDQEPYGQVCAKGVDYLIKQAKTGGGYIGDNMYSHALATLALSEVWGMSDREELRDTLKRAVQIIIRAQDRTGGWRYRPEPSGSDVSVTVMQVVALASAKEAGIYVPDKVITNAIKYVKSCQTPVGGFAYQPGGPPGLARTAAGLLSLQLCGDRAGPAAKKGLEYLRTLPDTKFQESEYYFYGHYYAMQAMYQAGESSYQQWYPKIRDALLQRQRADGSWDDPPFGTPIGVLVLGVPYRFLPIYQR